jgi:hypothetical protein
LATLLSEWLQREHGINRTIPLVGCVCHKLNLAVKALINSPENANVVAKVHTLMSQMSTLKNSIRLATVTKLNPEIENETRWNSTYRMLDKYLKLIEPMNSASFPADVKKLFLKKREIDTVKVLVSQLEMCNDYSISFQSQNWSVNTMATTRKGLNELLEKLPQLGGQIHADHEIVHCNFFDNAIVQLQRGKESLLTEDERNSVAMYLISSQQAVDTSCDEEKSKNVGIRLAREVEAELKSSLSSCSNYACTKHVLPTSVLCECLFSVGNSIMTPQRRHMDPSTFEMIIILKKNRQLFDACTVTRIIARLAHEVQQTKKQRTENNK